MDNRALECVCVCGSTFPAKAQLKKHQDNCDHAKVAHWESVLTRITSVECKCYCCGQSITRDQVLYLDRMIIYRPDDNTYVSSHCAGIMYPHEQERLMWPHEVQEYLWLRQTSMPYPWLKEYRTNLVKELQEYLHHPARVQKWVGSGRKLESYLN